MSDIKRLHYAKPTDKTLREPQEKFIGVYKI